MIDILFNLYSKFKEIILAIVFTLGTLFIVYFKGKKEGEDKVKQQLNELNQKARKERESIDDKIKELDTSSLDKRASRWLRDTKG